MIHSLTIINFYPGKKFFLKVNFLFFSATQPARLLYTFFLCILFSCVLMAQEVLPDSSLQNMPPDTACAQRDISDVIRKAKHKPPKEKSEKTSSLIAFPIIGSNPATGFMFGLGGQYAFKMKESLKYSIMSGSLQATSKNQYLVIFKNNIYTKKEKIFFTGDWRFQIFSQSTYGLGTNAPVGGVLDYQFNLAGIETTVDSLTQPMKYNFLRIHQSMAFKIKKSMYLGFGLFLDGYSKINDERLRFTPGDTLITSHYAYSKKYGFSTDKYYSSALHAAFVIDKRDNMIQPYKGYFLNIGWRGALEILGSEKNANMANIEWRSYHNVSPRNPTHLVAFWLIGEFSPEGQFPYMTLPATAYDQRSRSGRGYTQGRFRGNQYSYGEAEYRFPISKCGGVWSGVAFVNATSANNPVQKLKLFESIQPGYGLGLRIMLDKASRTNLTLDYGLGKNSSGFYLAVSETF
jgi:outer membrane protein assembly factor BamA